MTAPYSVLHFLVDGICAFAMFGHFSTWENRNLNVLLYNFCAFAMQMPLGVVLDGLNGRRVLRKYPFSFIFAVSGVVLTFIGAVTHPVVLGLGNALFHLGGGVGTIHEDEAKGWRGRGLGVFVAPGALGLYLGTQLAKGGVPADFKWLVAVAAMLAVCAVWCVKGLGTEEPALLKQAEPVADKETLLLTLGCLAVVILRSHIGMAVSFSWKTTCLAGLLAVLAVVLGKVAGGFAAAGLGVRRTVAVSLLLSALCYIFSENMAIGVSALFFFNMTMPITLYLLVQRLKGLWGFSFGFLTFSLFLGFLPTYLGIGLPADGQVIGCVGSVLSLVILWMCTGKE